MIKRVCGWTTTPDFETESPTDVLSSTSSKSGKASSSKSSSGGTSSPTATKSSKSKAAKLFKGKASSSKTSTDTSADDVSGETGTANTEENTKEDLPNTVSLEAHDFDLTSMSMQLADGDGGKKKPINHGPARRRAIL